MSESYVGIDVSKDVLDVACSDGRVLQVGNDAAGFAALRGELAGEVPGLVALRIVNARHVRHFAKATGALAKTDRLDAQALVQFAQALRPEPRSIQPEHMQGLQALIVRRRQLLAMLMMEKNRLHTAHRGVRADLRSSIRSLEKRLRGVDEDIDGALQACGALREKIELLESVPGIARVTAVNLVATLPRIS